MSTYLVVCDVEVEKDETVRLYATGDRRWSTRQRDAFRFDRGRPGIGDQRAWARDHATTFCNPNVKVVRLKGKSSNYCGAV